MVENNLVVCQVNIIIGELNPDIKKAENPFIPLHCAKYCVECWFGFNVNHR